MNIITEKEINGRVVDGIATILNLSDKDFNKCIEKLTPRDGGSLEEIYFYYTTDSCECPENEAQLGLETTYENNKFVGRSYFGAPKTSVHDILYQFSELLPKFEKYSKGYERIKRLLKTRDIDALKKSKITEKTDKELLDKVFQILTDDDTLKKFLDFESNKKEFVINDEEIQLGEYLRQLGNIFGNRNNKGKLKNGKEIYNNFYIPELQEYVDRYNQILDTYNMDRYVNPMYEFRRFNSLTYVGDCIIRQDEEPKWTINPELKTAVYKGFPEDGTLEEKAMHIYCSLCKELQYDDGYFYRDELKTSKYDFEFCKENLESIIPNAKITCWDFSRVFSKMINDLEGDIEAVIISKGINQGHFLAGFYTDKVSATVEAINSKSNSTNDLMKAKHGIKFEGIEIISDREGLIEKALDKVYPKVYGKEQIGINEYVEQLKSLPKEDIPNNLQKKIEAFTEVMKENNIFGNEAMQTLNLYYKTGFFGEELKKAFVGKKKEIAGKEQYKRILLITPKIENMQTGSTVYSIDTEKLDVSVHTAGEVIKKLNSGEFIYEDDKHTLPKIDEEGR